MAGDPIRILQAVRLHALLVQSLLTLPQSLVVAACLSDPVGADADEDCNDEKRGPHSIVRSLSGLVWVSGLGARA